MTELSTAPARDREGGNTPQLVDCWHALRAEDALSALGSDAVAGLSVAESERRVAEYGSNSLPEPRQRSFARVFLGQFKSPLIYLLFVAAGVAFALGHRTDAGLILAVVFLNAVIGTVQEGRAERSLKALRKLTSHRTRVVRNHQELVIEARNLVPGDIVLIEAGDAIAADARLLEGSALQIAEAALTGESAPVAKATTPQPPDTPLADRADMVYAGTHVTAGRARAVAERRTGVGDEAHRTTALDHVPRVLALEVAADPLAQETVDALRHVDVNVRMRIIDAGRIGLAAQLAFEPVFHERIDECVVVVGVGRDPLREHAQHFAAPGLELCGAHGDHHAVFDQRRTLGDRPRAPPGLDETQPARSHRCDPCVVAQVWQAHTGELRSLEDRTTCVELDRATVDRDPHFARSVQAMCSMDEAALRDPGG
jgi:hypothetical protein